MYVCRRTVVCSYCKSFTKQATTKHRSNRVLYTTLSPYVLLTTTKTQLCHHCLPLTDQKCPKPSLCSDIELLFFAGNTALNFINHLSPVPSSGIFYLPLVSFPGENFHLPPTPPHPLLLHTTSTPTYILQHVPHASFDFIPF